MLKSVSLASFVLVASLLGSAAAAAPKPQKPNYWFSFGDSYTQTWFNHTDIPPSPGNPLGNPPYPGWTATGGPNWVGYVTTEYNNSLVLTWNYAYGGAVIDPTLVTPWQPNLLHLVDQVDEFLTYAAKKPAVVPWKSENSLFSFFIGINDIGNSFWLPGSRDEFNDVLINRYFELVQKVYNAGGRNFLFVTVPPIDQSPLQLSQTPESREQERVVIESYNQKLKSRIRAFEKTDRKIKTWIWDSNKQYHKILSNYEAYGFKNVTGWAKENPDYFWGDNYHPSTYADRWFAKEVGQNVLGKTIW